jgi:(1->4)-alpha-D-glucan 1-alpha-D-glucosylmutase
METEASATYRFQFGREFRFADAQALVPYLSRLGATHLYSSPVLRARDESTHGYDVVDPTVLNPNLGGETEFRSLVAVLKAHGMGTVLDIVPNHMATGSENPFWMHVLTYGPSSPYARWFDIDWRLPDPDMWGRVLVPILGDPLEEVLERSEIAVRWREGRFRLAYYDHLLPVDPATVPSIGRFGFRRLGRDEGGGADNVRSVARILDELASVPVPAVRVRRPWETSPERIEGLLAGLARSIESSPRMRIWAEETASRFGSGRGGRTRLLRLLEEQPYRLVYWRRAARLINYRRFFNINDLISLRQEDPQVFGETHALVGRLIAEGLIDGLRVDHIDGLRDPEIYLGRLSELARESAPTRRVRIWVEKILGHGESLPARWPVEGTTGYEFLNAVERIFVDPAGFSAIESAYRQMAREPRDFREHARWGKRKVLKDELSAFVGRLAHMLDRLVQQDSRYWDLTEGDLGEAIAEVAAAFPVYRTHISGEVRPTVESTDRARLEEALKAAEKAGAAAPRALDLLREVLLLAGEDRLEEHQLREHRNFIRRFQQLTGPAAAKGIEDTALYAYVPLVSLNEVGNDPELPLEDAVADLHRLNKAHARSLPQTLLCVTTHDTKRGADVRARLDVLSERPGLWLRHVRRWRRRHRVLRRGPRNAYPDFVNEYLLYQTLTGIWPYSSDPGRSGKPSAAELEEIGRRTREYMRKAAREAKLQTDWANVDEVFEQALDGFIRDLLGSDKPEKAQFLTEMEDLVKAIASGGYWNALSRTLIQFTAPGTPDLYQGDELWNPVLVDPDNRRKVDYAPRERLLDELVTEFEAGPKRRSAMLKELVASPWDGRIKMHVLRTLLQTRRGAPEVFADGTYEEVEVRGARSSNVFAFIRRGGRRCAVAVAPRLTARLVRDASAPPIGPDVWLDSRLVLPADLSAASWVNVLTGEKFHVVGDGGTPILPLTEALGSFPVALFMARTRFEPGFSRPPGAPSRTSEG